MDWLILVCVICAIAIICSLLDKLSKRVKSKSPPVSTPVETPLGSWETWDESIHKSFGQAGRMQRALMQGLRIEDAESGPHSGRYRVRGWKGNIYSVGYESCTCKDFERRHLPCKHMYLLAMETLGFNPVPYIILNDTPPHPLRGYMNLGKYKVKGENPDTEKMTTKTVYAQDERDAIWTVRTSTILVEPFSVTEIAYPEAKEEEVETAKSLGAYVPEGAKQPDVRASIQRYKDVCETTIGKSQWKYASSLGVPLSALSGEVEASGKFHRIHKRWYSEEQAEQRLKA